jgi:serine/threonine-protein kinase HipA
VNRCPFTYRTCGDSRYSTQGLRRLSPRLTQLNDFPYDARTQRAQALIHAGKMSIQGVQPKLSVVLSTKEQVFQIVDQGGEYIIKPQHQDWPELPENEGITMHMAGLAGIRVPISGLVRCVDGSWSYFIKRFDRHGRGGKRPLEDFSQLAGKSRDSKYDFSMEKLPQLLADHCTFPQVESVKLYRLALFSFLVGNEDLHLKNFSLISTEETIELSPAYDLLSSTVALMSLGKPLKDIEECALPLSGKKKNISRALWVDYFGRERLGLPQKVIDQELQGFANAIPLWFQALDISFLSETGRKLYRELLVDRSVRLGLIERPKQPEANDDRSMGGAAPPSSSGH